MASATITRTPTNAEVPGVRLYFKVSGVALAATAALGLALNAIGAGALLGNFLTFDWTHNVVHVLLAAVALALGFGAATPGVARGVAKLVGVVYLGLALVGFASATIFGLGTLVGLHLEIGENLVHLLIGAWGAYAGFSD